jgi:hypothetical protein
MTFDSVAREIVSNSIRSAICIDDDFVEPYKAKTKNARDVKKPKKLMESFRKSNCSLDIYRFQGYKQLIDKDADFVFKNRDLLILDWALTKDETKFNDTLSILKDAVENPGLVFVLIYTWEPDLAKIELNIRSFFNNVDSDRSRSEKRDKELKSRLNQKFFDCENGDIDFDDAETFFEKKKVKEIISDLAMGESSTDAIKKFKDKISKLFGDNNIGSQFLESFEEILEEVYNSKNLFDGCEQIEFKNRGSHIRDIPYPSPPYCYKIHGRKHALWAKNTYITIFQKGEPDPEFVYEQFSDQLCKRPGNIMTLIALEMKNNFRENSAKIGKDLLAIDELAFFHLYQKDQSQDREEFYNFLRNNWKHQVASFHLNSDSKVFGVLPDYIKKENIDGQLKRISNGGIQEEKFHRELATLNFQYSFHHQEKKRGDYIRFGDIFSVHNSAKAENTEEYLLNITAHCDCLRPLGINYNYHLVSGSLESSLKSPLKKATRDEHALSFLIKDGNPICIKWKIKPFTAFIPEEKRFISPDVPIEIRINDKIKFLLYKGTMLENYTQRIANKSFAQAGRVGIDLAEL